MAAVLVMRPVEGEELMFVMLIGAMGALLAIAMASCWRDPKNWSANSETGTLQFTAWAELSAFGTLMAIIALSSLLFIG